MPIFDHNLRTENGARCGWQWNIARMHVAGVGNSSARLLPVPKPANDAANGCQVDVSMMATPLRPSLLQLCMSGPPRVSRSCGVTWRSRARHVSRAQTAAPERTRAFGAGGPVNEGRKRAREQLRRGFCRGDRFVAQLRAHAVFRAPWRFLLEASQSFCSKRGWGRIFCMFTNGLHEPPPLEGRRGTRLAPHTRPARD